MIIGIEQDVTASVLAEMARADDPRFREYYTAYYELTKRRGISLAQAQEETRTGRPRRAGSPSGSSMAASAASTPCGPTGPACAA